MPEYAMDSLPDALNGRLQNSPPGGVITAACTREVVRCNGCFLVQFRTSSDLCRRCANPLLPQPPPNLGEAGGPGNGETIPTVSVASSSKRIFRDDPRLRGELTR